MTYFLVLTTCPDRASAQRLADLLVERRLAACVNLIPHLQSTYIWQGTLQHASECQMLIKTRQERYAALEQAIRKHHPYELPEIIAVPLADGLPDYLRWIDQQTEPDA